MFLKNGSQSLLLYRLWLAAVTLGMLFKSHYRAG